MLVSCAGKCHSDSISVFQDIMFQILGRILHFISKYATNYLFASLSYVLTKLSTMSVVDRIRLEKFCFMFDLYLSVQYTSVFLIVLWIIYAIGVLASHGNVGSIIWGLIWTLANIAAFLGVIYGMQKTRKTFLLPAVILVPIFVIIGVVNGIINFVTLSIFG